MILISHRGNTYGKEPELENTPQYIQHAVKKGYVVEIDVWGSNNGHLFLGHDTPDTKIGIDFLSSGNYVIHAKNHLAIESLQYYNLHWFWHNTDDYTITSHGWVWAYPDKPNAGRKCIAVLPEIHQTPIGGFAGICSDFIEDYAIDFKR